MIPELEKLLGVKFPPAAELQSDSAREFLSDVCTKNNIDCSAPRTSARLLDKMVSSPSIMLIRLNYQYIMYEQQ